MVFGIPVVKGGEGKDMVSTVPIAVDGHEHLVPFGILHLKDQHTEQGIIVGGTEEGVSSLRKSWELVLAKLVKMLP